jgi:hypothetical protein
MTTGQQATRAPGNRPSQRVLVIIPTFNERENLPLIHQRVKAACPEVHVLIVDDSSPDGTWPDSRGVWVGSTRCLSRWMPTAAMRPSS